MKVLLITDVPPSRQYSGTLLTEQLCLFLKKEELAFYFIMNPAIGKVEMNPTLASVPAKYFVKPTESACGFWKFKPIATFFKEFYNRHIKTRKILNEIIEFAIEQKIDRIWCILQGQTMIRIARRLVDYGKFSVHCQVWDSPEWWLTANSIDKLSSNLILKDFSIALEKSKSVGAASWCMADDYKNRFNKNSIPLVAALDINSKRQCTININAKNSGENDDDAKEIVIAIAGQIYATSNWNALLDALISVNWVINNKKVKIKFLGYTIPPLFKHSELNIELLGYRSQEEAISILSEADMLYLPYWFEKEYEIIARSSFPSKLTTYLACGKPVLCHAPDYASPKIFLKEHNAAMFIDSLKPKDILDSIEKLDKNKTLARTIAENGTNAFSNFLTFENLKDYFFEFIK